MEGGSKGCALAANDMLHPNVGLGVVGVSCTFKSHKQVKRIFCIPQYSLNHHRRRAHILVAAVISTTSEHVLSKSASVSVRPHRFKSLYSAR